VCTLGYEYMARIIDKSFEWHHISKLPQKEAGLGITAALPVGTKRADLSPHTPAASQQHGFVAAASTGCAVSVGLLATAAAALGAGAAIAARVRWTALKVAVAVAGAAAAVVSHTRVDLAYIAGMQQVSASAAKSRAGAALSHSA